MKQKNLVITVLIGATVAIVAYFIGNTNGYSRGQRECTQKLTRPEAYWDELIALEKSYLIKSFPAHLPQFQTGKYRLETTFPTDDMEPLSLELKCIDGKFSRNISELANGYLFGDLQQDSNLIYFTLHNTDEKPEMMYIGTITEDHISGRVYVPSSVGWHYSPPHVGMWELYKDTD